MTTQSEPTLANVAQGVQSVLTHIVIFRWRDGTTTEEVGALRQALDRMAAEMADIATISHGPDLRFRDGNGDYALIATFPDRAGWDAYQADPRHQAFVQEVVSPLLASRVVVQI